jgi:hypothetical protein
MDWFIYKVGDIMEDQMGETPLPVIMEPKVRPPQSPLPPIIKLVEYPKIPEVEVDKKVLTPELLRAEVEVVEVMPRPAQTDKPYQLIPIPG